MKKILYSNFDGMDDIISKILSSKDMKKMITRNNLYQFWDKTVGEKFAKLSFPYGMTKGNLMIIACKNSMVGQELVLRKHEILEKLIPFAKSLNIKVTDLKFDPKKWKEDDEE